MPLPGGGWTLFALPDIWGNLKDGERGDPGMFVSFSLVGYWVCDSAFNYITQLDE